MNTGERGGKHHSMKTNQQRSFRLAPVAQAIALTIAAAGSAHAAQPFSAGWYAAKGALQETARSTGMVNGKPVSTLTNPAVQQQQANAQLQQSIANLGLAARGIALQQASQTLQRAAVMNSATSVPNGLSAGGLDTGSLASSWINAVAPTQTTDANGKVVVGINQTADKAIANWESFNVGKNTIVQFNQASSDWAILNRIVDPLAAPSQIQGQIKAPGTVLIVNRNGIVFSGSSQINTRNLVAAAADISDSQFTANGIYGPNQTTASFTNANGALIVEQGAQLATNTPGSVTQGGGYVLLMGKQVSNAGEIETPRGQVELAAGDNFIIRKGAGTDANTFSTTRGNEIAPQRIVNSTAGQVSNTGLLMAREGDVTLAGHDVRQNGVAVATTTVNTRGTIHLLNAASDTTGLVTLGGNPDIVTAVVIGDDGATALDSQRDALIADSLKQNTLRAGAGGLFDNLSKMQDREDQSRIEIVSGGDVRFAGGSLTLATGGQIVVSAANRTFAADGAILDVSGQVGVNLAMSSNNVVVNVQGNELRDSPANRDSGTLFNSNITVDRRSLIEVRAIPGVDDNDRWYTANGLLEVSGYLNNQGHSVGEWAAQGGTIQLGGKEVVTQKGSQLNLSGGSLNVATGYVAQTWLVGSDGNLYNANNAPADISFTGVYKGFEVSHPRWGKDASDFYYNPLIAPQRRLENGYTVGRDAGQLIVNAPTAVMEGDIIATVFNGIQQVRGRDALDGYQQAQTAVAQAATLAFGQYTALGLSNAWQSEVKIGEASTVTDGMTATDALSPDRLNTVYLEAAPLSDAALGGLMIATKGTIGIDAPLMLANGGSLKLIAPAVDLNADIVAHGGNITVTNALQPDAASAGLLYFMPASGRAHIILADGVAIDAGGLWTQGRADPDKLSRLAYLDGGTVTLTSTNDVTLGNGSLIDVSSGAATLPGGKTQGGRGGNVALFAYDETQIANPPGKLLLNGDIRGYGVGGGGTLAIDAASVLIGQSGAAHAADQLLLTPALFHLGFSAYDLNGHEQLAVADGTVIDVDMPVYRFGAASVTAPTGISPAAALDLWTPPQYQEDPVHGVLIQRAGADVMLASDNLLHAGQLTFGTGAVLSVDPGRHITLQSPGQITIDGTLHASGGTIDVLQMNTASAVSAPANPRPGQRSIWLGDDAVLDVAAHAVTATDNRGRRYGVVPDGGTITIGAPTKRENGDGVAQAAESFIVVRPGAVLDASGTSAVIDLPQGGAPLAVTSDGGAIALSSFNGLYLDGAMRAFSGGAGASGGSLLLTLETGRYKALLGDPPIPDEVRYIRELVIGQDTKASGSDAPLQIGTGRISVQQIAQGGFDTLSAFADVIGFEGNVNLALGREIELYHTTLAVDRPDASITLSAPYVAFRVAPYHSLDGNPVYPRAGLATSLVSTTPTMARLTVDADLIDVYSLGLSGAQGNLPLLSGSRAYNYLGFDSATLSSNGDIRIIGGISGSRLLELDAAQLYPVTGTISTIMARDLVRFGRTGTDTPDLPYSVFGNLSVLSKAIEQGGVLRAPLGKITLGSSTTVGTPVPPITDTVALLPGSITSVSANGLVMPYGGTVDDINYLYHGAAVTAPASVLDGVVSGVTLAGKSFRVDAGALIDLSGGGDLRGAGFISGRGGSVDVLTTALANANPAYGSYSARDNQVYAIVPGMQAGYAPIDAGAGAAPGMGGTVTIADGVPGLKAGTYALMPARYALLPGAFRVELGGATTRPVDAVVTGNGSWRISGYQGITNTGSYDALPTQMIVTPGDTVRTYSQYKETGYADFLLANAARLGAPRPILPIDGKTLYLNYATQPSTTAPALTFDGKALFAPGEGGYGGILRVDGNTFGLISLEVVAGGAPATPGFVSIAAGDLNAIGATRMSLGSFQIFDPALNYVTTGSYANTLVLREGVVLQAPEVILGANAGGMTVEDGVKISTLGMGGATPLSAADGYSYRLNSTSTNILAVSNGQPDFLSLNAAASGGNAGIRIGASELYTEGTLLFATGTGGNISLSSGLRFGAKNLSFAVSGINIGENAAVAAASAFGVLPDGLLLNQQVLGTLLQGNQGIGVPKVESLLLSASRSINFFGSVNLDTIDPATGKSSLAELVLNTPAIYGLGDAGDRATITTGTLIWNGVGDGKPYSASDGPASMPPPAVIAFGPGTGHGTLDIVADQIVFGYRNVSTPDTQLTLDRLALGFSTVNLKAGERISANNRNSLSVYHTGTDAASYAGGDLNLVTPLLTGEGASINHITAGGALTVSAPTGATAAASEVTGAEIGLKGQSVTIDGTIALPSGKLTVEADGALTLTDRARIDMAGRAVTLIDVTKYSWGGDVVLTSKHGDITQAGGAVIDLSAQHNRAGTLAVSATDAAAGTVSLLGTVLGSALGEQVLDGTLMPFSDAFIDVRAQTVADFSGLNERLTRDGVFGSRSFQIEKEGVDLVVGDELRANSIALSVDGGSLTVNGKVDASGLAVGTIRLGARDGLTLASTALLDAHGTRLRVDSYGQPIDATNCAIVELTSSGPGAMLTLAPGATIDVRAADNVARGTVTLNASRLSETGGDIAIDARGPVSVRGATSIALNGFWKYSPTDADGTIVQDNGGIAPLGADGVIGLNQIDQRSVSFMNAALANGDLQGRLGGLMAYDMSGNKVFHLRPGVEINSNDTPNGNLTIKGDLDLSGFRYGPGADRNPASASYGAGEPGSLVIRASGNLEIDGSINDGFAPPPGTPDDTGFVILAAGTLSGDKKLSEGITLDIGTQFVKGSVLPFDLSITGTQALLGGQVAPVTMTLPNFADGYILFPGTDPLTFEVSDTVYVVQGQIDDFSLGFTYFPGDPISIGGLGSGAVIHAGTILTATNPTNANLVVSEGPMIGANTAIHQSVNLASSYTVAAALRAAATIVTPTQTYAAGTVIPAGTILPAGTTLGVGAMLPFDFSIQSTTWMAGTPLDFNGGYTLTAPQTVAAGEVIPAGSVIGQNFISSRVGKTWAVAPMLPAGSQSWSVRLVSGANTTASDSRALLPANAGNLILDDMHLSGAGRDQAGISVVRTGTGDLELLAAGNIEMKSLFGIYTAGTQSAGIGANGVDPFNQPRGLEQVSTGGGTTVLGAGGSVYEPLVRGPSSIYQAWYPDQGGNLLVSAQGDITGYTTTVVNDPGKWLWRQGGDMSGLPTAWWINFGSYVYGFSSSGVQGASLAGFGGFGALGGGNVTVQAGGDAGELVNMGDKVSQGLNIAVGGSGRMVNGQLVQTGGGDLTLRVGGALNSLQNGLNRAKNMPGDEGVLADVRGTVSVDAGAIGRIDLAYGWSQPAQFNADPRPVDPRAPNFFGAAGGPVLFVGDAAASLSSRGDLVLSKADDLGRAGQSNTTPYTLNNNGAVTAYGGGGSTGFSLWTEHTAIDLFAAGGNLTPVVQTTSTDYPATLRAVAAQGSIYYGVLRDNMNPIAVSLTLAPSPTGQLEILARDSIYTLGMPMNMSGADSDAVPTPFRPAFIGTSGSRVNASNLSSTADAGSAMTLYAFGPNTVTGNLHAGDDEPQLFYAVEGDIVGLRTGEIYDFTHSGSQPSTKPVNTWYAAAKPVRIIAGRDIVGSGELPTGFFAGDKPVYPAGRYSTFSIGNIIYHPDADDVSVVSAGRDILYANFQVAGPGTLDVSAGRNIYQADKGSITSIGALASGDTRPGASIFMQAGVGAAGPDYTALASLYLDPANRAVTGVPLADQAGKVVKTYEQELVAWLAAQYGFAGSADEARATFSTLGPDQQNLFLRQVYFAELREGGREYTNPDSARFGSYLRGREVIATLFPDSDATGTASGTDTGRGGDIILFGGAGVHTNFGGDIQMFAPSGQIIIGVDGKTPPASAGLITQGSGNIELFSQGSILLGLSRIMTTFGGDILAWSAQGDINAGRGAKTTVLFTPPKRTYDDVGNVAIAPDVPSTGAGIATLAPIPEVPAGDVDLIAPLGTIDAGEAGIRVSGNVNLAALQVANAANIQVQGKSTGLPVAATVNVNALTNAGAAATQAAMAAQDVVGRERTAARQALPSIFTVRVLGFGNEPVGGADNATTPSTQLQSAPVRYNPSNMVQVVGLGEQFDPKQMSRMTEQERRRLTQD